MFRRTRLGVMCAVLLSAALPLGSSAEPRDVGDCPVPVEQQIPLFIKILSFDRNYRLVPDTPLVVGVVHQHGFRRSLVVLKEVVDAVDEWNRQPQISVTVDLVPIDIDDVDLGLAIGDNHVDVIYITPLRSTDLASVTAASRAAGVTSITGVPGYVEDGVTVGIDVRGRKPEILVNLGGAEAEGANFSSRLLRLAHITQGRR